MTFLEHLMACRQGVYVPPSNASAPPLPPPIRDEHVLTRSTRLVRDSWTGELGVVHEVTPRHGWRAPSGCLRPAGLVWLDGAGR